MRYYILAALIIAPLFASLHVQQQAAYKSCQRVHSLTVCLNTLK